METDAVNVEEENQFPENYFLTAYPNPFNPGTTISWHSPVGSWQTIKIFNSLGQEVDTIVNEYLEAGNHSKLYIANSTLTSGVYFAILNSNSGIISTQKLILLK